MAIPCGKCVGCRMENARQWGMRCLHEKKMWGESSYVTLTYADEFVPEGYSLSLRDVQLFMKRLRKKRGATKDNPIRFFLCGEYGDRNERPHYHALLFNCGFGDKLYFGRNKRGEPLFTSNELSDLWAQDGRSMGHCTIGEVTFESACYCAKYSLKKLNVSEFSDDEARARYEARYVWYDDDGVVYHRRPEFAVMSRNPGIGGTYYDKYGAEVVANDSVVVDGREVRPPRYYDKRGLDRVGHSDDLILCMCAICVNRRKRKRMAVLNKSDNTPERLRVKEQLMMIAHEKKEREL